MDELVADPFAALPLTPVATAGFLDQSIPRTVIPVFAAEKCTGCGDCFVECPHAALPPIAIGLEQLLKTGAEIVTTKKMTVSRITPMIKNIAKAANQTLEGKKVKKLRDFLPMAFDKVSRQMKMDEDKLEVAHSEFCDIMDELEDFQVAVTEPFFNLPESIESGRGELFSLSVDPLACTGCGLCAQVCDEQALTMVAQDAGNLSLVKKRFQIWEQLPDTSGDTIKRLQHEKAYSSLAAALLSRNYYLSMTGANILEPASNSKTLVHLITSITESVVQPKVLDQLQKIDDLIDALSENLHHKLSDALPKENLENLSESLQKTRRRKIHLHDLIDQFDEQQQGKFIDSEDLERKSILIKDLKNLRWILAEGPSGVGRSRFGLLVAGSESLHWIQQYPYNNLTSPVIIHWDGGTSAQAISVFYGQLRYQLDHLKLMRRADLESRDKYDPAEHDLAIAELDWDDLTDAEKNSVSPLLLIVDHQYISGYGWGHLNQLLAERYPIKVFLLDDLITHQKMPIADLSHVQAGVLTALAMKNAFVFQGSMGNTDHLFEGLMDGIHGLFPAFFRIHTTEFAKHTDSSIEAAIYSRIATDCRVFPLLKYHPVDKPEFLRGAIKLDGNPAMNRDWVEEQIVLDSDQTLKYPLSWADWAYTQNDWQSHFTPLSEGASWVMVAHYLALDVEGRKNTTPVILRADQDGIQYIAVSDQIIKVSEAVKDHWRTLQELAGALYEFPVKLRKEVERELTLGFQQQIEQIKNDFDLKLKNEHAEQMQKVKVQLKEKLLTLSQMAKDKIRS
jgi:pyruvate-ferredoxin/flavodoxin oxidoreductase